MSRHRVVVTGVGLVTPLAASLDELCQALLTSQSRFSWFTSRFGASMPVAMLPPASADFARKQTRWDRSVQFACLAAERAIADGGLHPRHPSLQDAGLFIGCGSGPSQAINDSYAALYGDGRLQGLTVLKCMHNGPAAEVAMRLGIRGATHTLAAACASSALAIGHAMRAIRHGYLDLALAGGVEAPFGDGNVEAWSVLRVIASSSDGEPSSACRPFDARRNGLVLGEGGAVLVLESEEHAVRRGARLLGEILGFGESCDATHWTEPDEAGQTRAIRKTLEDAALQPHEVAAVNAHGTGTRVGDLVESASLRQVFGDGASGPPVSSTKAHHGHLLGAAAAVELVAALCTVKTGLVPATRNLSDPDPELRLNLVRGEAHRSRPGRAVLSNSFAFGGVNACLAIGLGGD